jgi:Skp family chaperone for outer membrane proteins
MNDELNKKTFKELSDIINEWGKNNSIDLIMGKMEVVYLDDKYDATNDILSILKEKNMFVEFKETEKESV